MVFLGALVVRTAGFLAAGSLLPGQPASATESGSAIIHNQRMRCSRIGRGHDAIIWPFVKAAHLGFLRDILRLSAASSSSTAEPAWPLFLPDLRLPVGAETPPAFRFI